MISSGVFWWMMGLSLAWCAWAIAAHALVRGPRGLADAGLFWRLSQAYAAGFHRLRVEGREHLPDTACPGPMIVVANHTSGVDPVLIQSACRFEIRWMMAADMQLPAARRLWEWTGVIPVERTARDTRALRDALRHLHRGGVVGVFPEGGIGRPRGVLLPFLPGVGLMIQRSGAPVLPMVLEGTPDAPTAYESLWKPSRSRLRIMPLRHYGPADRHEAITRDLEERFLGWTGARPGARTPETLL